MCGAALASRCLLCGIIVPLAIWIAAIWILVCAPGTRHPALLIKFPVSTHFRRGF